MKTCISIVASGALLLAAGCTGGEDPPPTAHAISGVVRGAEGVAVSLSGAATRATAAGAGGAYAFGGLADGAYVVAPSGEGCTFAPVSREVVVSGADVAAVDFAGACSTPTHAIAGIATIAWAGALPGVTVTLEGASSGSAVTDASGRYAFAALGDGSYTVTAGLAAHAFTPAAPTVIVSGADRTQDFAAHPFFTLTTVAVPWNAADFDARCAEDYGAGYRIADWSEVAAFVGAHGFDLFFSQAELALYRSHGWVTRGGAHLAGPGRHYFVERHDGAVPAGWLVHATLGANVLDLGSWNNARPTLCAWRPEG